MATHLAAIRADPRIKPLGLLLGTFSNRKSSEATSFDAALQMPVTRRRQLIEATLAAADASAIRRGQATRARQPVAAQRPESERNSRRFDGLRVLLVEDNLVNQRLATRLLERLGCKVVLAENGRDAITFAFHQPFDLCLMDCHMPEMDGFEATRVIRTLEEKRLPIVALTADAMQGDRERCIAAGMDDYLSKPIRQQELGETIDRWCRVARAA
jgi:CheY-like chemotaxis protein